MVRDNVLRYGMALSSIRDGGVHNGVSFGNVGFTMALILPYLDRTFVHTLLRVRISYYACGY